MAITRIEFPDGSTFHRDMDPNPVRLKDGRFGTKGIKATPDPHQQAKTRLSNVRSELTRMQASGKATPEMLDRKRKSLAEAEDAVKKLGSGESNSSGFKPSPRANQMQKSAEAEKAKAAKLKAEAESLPDSMEKTKILAQAKQAEFQATLFEKNAEAVRSGRPEEVQRLGQRKPISTERLHPEMKAALKKQGMELQALREKLRDRLAKENEEVKELTRTHGEDHPRTLEALAKVDRTVKEANEALDRIQEIRNQGVSVPKGKPQPVAPKETPKVSEEPPKPIVSPSSIQAQKTSTEPKGPQKRASAGEIKQLSGRPKYEAALPAVDELSANFRKEFSAVRAEASSLGYRIKDPQLSMRDGQPILKFEVDTPRDIRHPDENPYMTYNHPDYHTGKASAYRQKVSRVEDFVNNTFSKLEDFSRQSGIERDF